MSFKCNASDCKALLISSASCEGSGPFGGAFEVWDLDYCSRTDPEIGERLVDGKHSGAPCGLEAIELFS